jgi:HD-GYP domain-containing protein (c-di-GMP phosphodiesterase class II)
MPVAPQGGTLDRTSSLYCLVPPELAELREELARALPENARFNVVLDRRRGERRAGSDRRGEDRPPPTGIDRRLAEDLEGRRFVERRALLAPVDEPPPLPPPVRPYADRLRFVLRDELRSRMEEVERVRALAEEWRERCREATHESVSHLIRGQTEGRHALAAAMATRDAYTWEHSAAVVWLALQVGKEMGLGEEAMPGLHDVALLHDIGKIAVPDSILRKGGPLSQTEWEVMREHPVMGARLLDSVDTLRHLAPAVRSEHERWDGRGYPDGMAGEQIPIESRIVFVCDAYHAMVSERPYRKSLSAAEARAELAANAGTQFWPEAARALLTVLERSNPRDLSQIAIPTQPSPTTRPSDRPQEFRAVQRTARAVDTEIRADVKQARSMAQRMQKQRDALRFALEGLLEATRKRGGYSPRAFLARVRAESVLRKIDSPPDSDD